MADEQNPQEVARSEAEAFVTFQYAEIKDLTKQFLTVVAAVLALSITFSEKIVNFAHASKWTKVLMIASWGFCLLAFVLGGCALFWAYDAGMTAKSSLIKEVDSSYEPSRDLSQHLLLGAGGSFVVALLLLVILGILKLF